VGFDHFMVHVEIGTRRKLRRNFSVPERWCYVAGVLSIAATAPVRGRLLIEGERADEQDVAERAGVSLTVARSTMTKLREKGMVVPDEDMECERVHDWEEHNPEPKRDKTAAERARRYRERLSRQRNGTVTRDATRDERPRHAPEVEGEGEVRVLTPRKVLP
jgi:hypothetical protein